MGMEATLVAQNVKAMVTIQTRLVMAMALIHTMTPTGADSAIAMTINTEQMAQIHTGWDGNNVVSAGMVMAWTTDHQRVTKHATAPRMILMIKKQQIRQLEKGRKAMFLQKVLMIIAVVKLQ